MTPRERKYNPIDWIGRKLYSTDPVLRFLNCLAVGYAIAVVLLIAAAFLLDTLTHKK